VILPCIFFAYWFFLHTRIAQLEIERKLEVQGSSDPILSCLQQCGVTLPCGHRCVEPCGACTGVNVGEIGKQGVPKYPIEIPKNQHAGILSLLLNIINQTILYSTLLYSLPLTQFTINSPFNYPSSLYNSIGYPFLRSSLLDEWELPKQDANFLTHRFFTRNRKLRVTVRSLF